MTVKTIFFQEVVDSGINPVLPSSVPSLIVAPDVLALAQTEKVLAPKLEIQQNPLNDLIRAIQWVESRNDTNARNGKSTATGVLQILEVTLKDFNRITKKGYVMDDRLDSLKSVEIFMTIQNHYNPTLNFKMVQICMYLE